MEQARPNRAAQLGDSKRPNEAWVERYLSPSWVANDLFNSPLRRNNKGMAEEDFSGPIPLVVGVLPDQHVEVLQTARTLAERLGVPLVCAYVDEASYLVEWDPSRETHRMSLHPEKDDAEVDAVRGDLGKVIAEAMDGGTADWTLRLLAGDPARALGRLASDINASMIIVGSPEPGLGHRISEALNGSVAAWLSHHQRRPVLIVPQKKRQEAARKN